MPRCSSLWGGTNCKAVALSSLLLPAQDFEKVDPGRLELYSYSHINGHTALCQYRFVPIDFNEKVGKLSPALPLERAAGDMC